LPRVDSASQIENANEHDLSANIHINKCTVVTNTELVTGLSFVMLKVAKRILPKKHETTSDSLSQVMIRFLQELFYLRVQLDEIAHSRSTYSDSGVSRASFNAVRASSLSSKSSARRCLMYSKSVLMCFSSCSIAIC